MKLKLDIVSISSRILKISRCTSIFKTLKFELGKIREDVVEANKYAWSIAKEFKLDCLDLHYHFRKQVHRRAKDGIHWDVTGKRKYGVKRILALVQLKLLDL
jgi:hypothetical protein